MEKLARLIYLSIIVVLLYIVFPFFLPFIFALILAVLFEPAVLFVQDKLKIKRAWSVISIFTAFFTLIFWLLFLIASKLFKEGFLLLKTLPNKIEMLLSDSSPLNNFYASVSFNNQQYLKETALGFVGKATEFLSTYAGSLFIAVKSFPAYFIALIVFMVAVYIMSIELPTLRLSFLKYFEKGQSQKKIEIVLDKLKLAIIGFLRAQVIFSVLTFIICLIGLKLIGVQFILVFSLLIVLVDLLPILGTGSVLIPWAIYLLATGESYQGVGLIILFLFITVFRRIIEPKFLANSLGLKPLITLVSMYIGFQAMGIIGMIIGPTIVIVVQALEEAELFKFRVKL